MTVLSTLKEKMAAVKDFYENSVPDDSLEDSMIRQIEEIRTEKYKEIEKLKEKQSGKIIELR